MLVVFSQAVQRVGLIGLAIGQPNKASEALIRAAASLGDDKKEDKKVASVTYLVYILEIWRGVF